MSKKVLNETLLLASKRFFTLQWKIVAEIYLNHNPDERNFTVQADLKKEFVVDDTLSIIELIFMLYDPDFIPGAITLHCIVSGIEKKLDIWTVTMGISAAKQNGVREKTPAKLSYTDSLEALHQLVLDQAAEKKALVEQEQPVDLAGLELALVGEHSSTDAG